MIAQEHAPSYQQQHNPTGSQALHPLALLLCSRHGLLLSPVGARQARRARRRAWRGTAGAVGAAGAAGVLYHVLVDEMNKQARNKVVADAKRREREWFGLSVACGGARRDSVARKMQRYEIDPFAINTY
jgi:hypothetical protein